MLAVYVALVNILEAMTMFVFALLLSVFAVLQSGPLARRIGLATQADRAAWAFGVMFVCTGLLHFLRPEPFLAMMPPALPYPTLLVYLSGAAEIVVAYGLLNRRTRRMAALAATALLTAILPANIYAAVSGAPIPGYPSAAWYRWLRVLLQLPLIFWVWTIWRQAGDLKGPPAARDASAPIP